MDRVRSATAREIERKYEADDGTSPVRLPDLGGAGPVARVVDRGTDVLDAVYYDTADRRLLAAGITLRRRTGGDAGWHLKLPVAPGVRDEVRAPLTDVIPRRLAALVRARTRGAPLAPLARVVSRRDVRHLLDARGSLLAEVSTDSVSAGRPAGEDPGAMAAWTEIEVELGPGADPGLFDVLEPRLREAGLRPSRSGSKLARALAGDQLGGDDPAEEGGEAPAAGDAARVVLAHLHEQAEAVVALDPGARLGTEDAVHQMRVATRRLRSALRTYGRLLDPRVTGPLGTELRWLAVELGADRDREVVVERLRHHLDDLPRPLVRGPVRARLRIWSNRSRAETRRRVTDALDSERHLALLGRLDALVTDPPLRQGAAEASEKALVKAVRRDHERLAARIAHALATDPGPARDAALHEARKAAKRARYAAEAAAPALGKDAKRLAKRLKAVQTVLGDHQDSVLTRNVLRQISTQAAVAGEATFTYGLLYGREEARAAEGERQLAGVWEEAAKAAP
ncbi:CYTH and CHAD domain-containing protein [Streptomyces mobaraensis]|uniref:CYTH and CHAD domain-containing protein n=1 Tax=Streptomyces mobaraensis TaxID=35621 RepID=A0A5N5WCT2_STRMB|nr:CYTH and CHAD domain-containing protein [Streptomyces mobaraensis]KAB7850083.1 CYTH and CHAD domain-containing protein [Streptomyces mobaraensis]